MSLSRSVMVLGWICVLGVVLFARAEVLAAPFSGMELAAWAFFGCAPIVIARFVVGGRPSPTIAQVLYPTEPSGPALQSGSSRRKGQS